VPGFDPETPIGRREEKPQEKPATASKPASDRKPAGDSPMPQKGDGK